VWQFEVDSGKSGVEKGWFAGKDFSQRIVVPFPPESSLSGIGCKDFMELVWYRRFFDVPEEWFNGRVLLHFGAVDYEARVWVNGSQVGYHRGGYTPFTCDITNVVKPKGNELVVWVRDECRSELQPTGKQCHRLKSFSCLYTRVTGIWQTVWLESVPHVYIRSYCLTTNPYCGNVFIRVYLKGQTDRFTLSIKAFDKDECVAEARDSFHGSPAELMLTVPSPRMWSLEDPYLYGLRLQLTDIDGSIDMIRSYFGFREIRIVGNRILLNNKTRFLRLVLDQGYYPDGIYTAPSDEALKRDIEISKAMGFDGARLHQKVFEPRFLYWADKLGYLVASEFPDWGADLSKSSVRDVFIDEWIEVLQRDFNHPCIIIWTPLNERSPDADFWPRLVRLTKLFDPTRLVIDSSGSAPHVETDIYDVHDYEQNAEKFRFHYADLSGRKNHKGRERTYKGQPFMVSEYGGIGWWTEPSDEKWGCGEKPKTLEELIVRYKALTECLLFNPAISGFCYTQLYDIEQEANGLYTYDRRPKIKPEVIRSINKQEAAIEKIYR
jgi:beta-galactosidase/beta-glucuronidase